MAFQKQEGFNISGQVEMCSFLSGRTSLNVTQVPSWWGNQVPLVVLMPPLVQCWLAWGTRDSNGGRMAVAWGDQREKSYST